MRLTTEKPSLEIGKRYIYNIVIPGYSGPGTTMPKVVLQREGVLVERQGNTCVMECTKIGVVPEAADQTMPAWQTVDWDATPVGGELVWATKSKRPLDVKIHPAWWAVPEIKKKEVIRFVREKIKAGDVIRMVEA